MFLTDKYNKNKVNNIVGCIDGSRGCTALESLSEFTQKPVKYEIYEFYKEYLKQQHIPDYFQKVLDSQNS